MSRFDRVSEPDPAEAKQVARPWFVQLVRDGEVTGRRFEAAGEAREWLSVKAAAGWEVAAYQEFVDGHWCSRLAQDADVDGRAKVAEVRAVLRGGS